MTRTSRTKLLEESLQVLVTHFGSQNVRAALARVAPDDHRSSVASVTNDDPRKRSPRPRVAQLLEGLRQAEPERHRLLETFLSDLRQRRVLATPDDIRHFANAVGVKAIPGRSRRDMIPNLIGFLVTLPVARLRDALESAVGISEESRQRGYSVLTDKLLSDTAGDLPAQQQRRTG